MTIERVPMVSVIVPCRNEEAFIAETISSVLSQTHKNLELIVVDDGSTDRTIEIIRSVDDARLRLLNGAGAGACAARNLGLTQASGELIQMLDGDDLFAPDKLELQIAQWREYGDDFVYFGPFARFTGKISAAKFVPAINWKDMSGLDWLVAAWSGGDMMAPHSWLTPMTLVKAAGDWDETVKQNQDGEYFSRVLLASKGVKFCDAARSYYRVAPKRTSISQRRDYAARESRLRSTNMMIDRMLASDDSEKTRRACGNVLEELMFMTYGIFPDLSQQAAERLNELGGGDGSRPFRGPGFKKIERFLGWRAACLIQSKLPKHRVASGY